MNRIATNSQGLVIIAIISIITVSFIPAKLLQSSLTSDLLSRIPKEYFIGVGAFFLLLFVLIQMALPDYWQRYKNTYHLSNSPFTLLDYFICFTIFLIFLIYIRHNYSFSFYTAACSALVFLAFLTRKFSRKSQVEKLDEGSSGALSDEPIERDDQDLLGREKFVAGLYKEVINIPFSDSFVFGLYADWGAGKTSVISLLNNKLLKDDRFIVVNFDPWYFSDEKALLPSFYEQVEKSISKKFILPGFKRTLLKYQKIISPEINIGVKFGIKVTETLEEVKQRVESYLRKTGRKVVIIIDDIDRLQEDEIFLILKLVRLNAKFKNTIFVLSLAFDATVEKIAPKTQSKAKDYIEKIIQKPITLPRIEQVHLDNFLWLSAHRIPQYEITELVKLPESASKVSTYGIVRQIENNTIALSRDYEGSEGYVLIEIKSSAGEIDARNLSGGQKIFAEGTFRGGKVVIEDDEDYLAPFRLSWIDILLWELLREEKITREDIKSFDADFIYFYRSTLFKLVQNLRDAKRYINSLYSSLPAIAKEVNLRDFCLLEFIKVYSPEIYDDIFENWWFYVDERSKGDVWVNPFAFQFYNEEQKKSELMQEHINKTIDQYETEPQRNEIFKEIIKKLFPNVFSGIGVGADRNARKSKSIYTQSFLKYFSLKVPPSEIADEFIESLFGLLDRSDKPEEDFEKVFFDLQKKYLLTDFLEKLRKIYLAKIPDKLVELIIKFIYLNAEKLSRRGRTNFWNSEFDKAETLLLALINTRLEKEKVQKTLEEAVQLTPDLNFAVGVVFSSRNRGQGQFHTIYESVNLEALRDIVASRLKAHFVDSGRDIFNDLPNSLDWGFILYQWGTNWMTFKGSNNKTVNEYVLSLVKDDARKFLRFLLHQTEVTPSGRFLWDLKKMQSIYDLSEFRLLAKKFKDQETLKQEEAEVLTSFLQQQDPDMSDETDDE